MFEAGKKYQDKGNNGLKVVEVLAATQKYAIIKIIIWESAPDFVGEERAWRLTKSVDWKEYIEPKVVSVERYVRCDAADNILWLSKNDTTWDSDPVIGKIRITHTEGQGLAVEVIG